MKLIAALLTFAMVTSVCFAESVSELVAQIPVKDSSAETALAAKLMAGGPAALKELCAGLVPLGTEKKDDTQTRDAISALVRYVGRKDGEADRAVLARALAESLATASDWEIRTFLVNRLQEAGHDESVAALEPLLADEKVGLHAAAALERVGTPAAIAALEKSLPAATGGRRVAIVKSLAMLRAAGAAEEIRKSAADDDKALRMTALWALANLGDASARDLLVKALQVEKLGLLDKTRLYDWTILDARRLAEAGKKQDAAAICAGLLDDSGDAHPRNVRIAAARSLVEIQGQAALEALLPLVQRGDVQFRVAVLDALARAPREEITPALVGRLKSVAQPEVKADLLAALAKRGDVTARAAIMNATRDADPSVRVAALNALVLLGREEAIPLLIERITTDTDATVVAKPAAEMLARMPGEKPLAAAGDALAAAPVKSKVALLELLAARAAHGQSAAVLKQAADGDLVVRLAALRAMEKVAGSQDLPRLIELALAAKDAGEESSAVKAAVAASIQLPEAGDRTAAWVVALRKAQGGKRAALERGLAKLGGAAALGIVVEDLKSSDKVAREGAIGALAEWQDDAAVAPLLAAAKSGDAAQQVTAIRGVVQVLKNSTTLSNAERVAAYSHAMAIAARPEERKMILGALANERGQDAFDLAAGALELPGVQAEASLAVIKIALPAGKGQAGLKGPTVVAALKKAIPACPDGGLKADAERYLTTLDRAK
ncbi:MAG: hypothetical protein JWN40_3575 [Phycisphaerales bacterium]|nr:hypothetical protein [Phycisphaerales bacterium]